MNDDKRLDEVLSALSGQARQPPQPPVRRSKHLCADTAAYRSADPLRTTETYGCLPPVVDRRKKTDLKRRDPKKKAGRWVVEVCPSWFNRFRNLIVRYEKLERSFPALHHPLPPPSSPSARRH